jgi:hypothetical protein
VDAPPTLATTDGDGFDPGLFYSEFGSDPDPPADLRFYSSDPSNPTRDSCLAGGGSFSEYSDVGDSDGDDGSDEDGDLDADDGDADSDGGSEVTPGSCILTIDDSEICLDAPVSTEEFREWCNDYPLDSSGIYATTECGICYEETCSFTDPFDTPEVLSSDYGYISLTLPAGIPELTVHAPYGVLFDGGISVCSGSGGEYESDDSYPSECYE